MSLSAWSTPRPTATQRSETVARTDSERDVDLNCSDFWRRPSSLDAYVFGHLAPILKCKLPNGKLQQHLKSLDNLSSFCTNILLLYFPRDGRGEARRRCRELLRSE